MIIHYLYLRRPALLHEREDSKREKTKIALWSRNSTIKLLNIRDKKENEFLIHRISTNFNSSTKFYHSQCLKIT